MDSRLISPTVSSHQHESTTSTCWTQTTYLTSPTSKSSLPFSNLAFPPFLRPTNDGHNWLPSWTIRLLRLSLLNKEPPWPLTSTRFKSNFEIAIGKSLLYEHSKHQPQLINPCGRLPPNPTQSRSKTPVIRQPLTPRSNSRQWQPQLLPPSRMAWRRQMTPPPTQPRRPRSRELTRPLSTPESTTTTLTSSAFW